MHLFPNCTQIHVITYTNRFYITRFGNLEWDYTQQENMEYKQLAVFVATTQLLANYSCAKKNWGTLQAHIVAVKTNDQSDTDEEATLCEISSYVAVLWDHVYENALHWNCADKIFWP